MQRPVAKATLVAVSLAASMLVATRSAAAVAPPPPGHAPATVPAEVTLVTGDRVLVGAPVAGRPTLTVEPATRSAGHIPSFSARYDGDDVYVVPSDVAGLVPGVLDDALFDVTALVRMGTTTARARAPRSSSRTVAWPVSAWARPWSGWRRSRSWPVLDWRCSASSSDRSF
jgi:hypothetical protein